MKKIILFVSVCCVFLLSRNSFAASTVYEVSKDKHKLYIAGTIHMLRKQDYPLPAEFDAAYKDSQTIVLESDLQYTASAEFGQKMAQAMTLENDKNLSTLLTPNVWSDLQQYINDQRLPIAPLIKFQPAFIGIILVMTEAKKMGAGDGVDVYYNKLANSDHKQLGALESGDDVIAYMKNLCNENPDATIMSALEELKTLHTDLPGLIDEWRAGDLAALDKDLAEKMRKETPGAYQSLIIERNKKWLPKIKAMLATPETEMILVGSLHLPGKNGLLAQLKNAGYKVKAL